MNYIFGSSGFGKEVLWILRQHGLTDIFFVELSNEKQKVNDIKVITQQDFKKLKGKKNCFLAVGSSSIREKMYKDIKEVLGVKFPNIVDPTVRQYEEYNSYGIGNIICAGAILTTNIEVGNFNHFNLNTTVGHDTIVGDFCTFSPGSNISGCVHVGNKCFFGTNSVILENLKISNDIVIGIPARLRS